MKKTLASVVLGAALLSVSGLANAEQQPSAESRWGIRSERGSAPSALDLARWLARRLLETAGDSILVPLAPPPLPLPSPGPGPDPDFPDEVCVPERTHCPMG